MYSSKDSLQEKSAIDQPLMEGCSQVISHQIESSVFHVMASYYSMGYISLRQLSHFATEFQSVVLHCCYVFKGSTSMGKSSTELLALHDMIPKNMYVLPQENVQL